MSYSFFPTGGTFKYNNDMLVDRKGERSQASSSIIITYVFGARNTMSIKRVGRTLLIRMEDAKARVLYFGSDVRSPILLGFLAYVAFFFRSYPSALF